MTPDLIIRNGTIFDGLGNPGAVGDMVVHGGRIASVEPTDATGVREIDATGLYVTPGFIDIHSHSDFTLLVDARAQSAVHQGVTLEVIGNCGHGCFPLIDKTLARNTIYGITDAIELDWSTPAAYLDRLEAAQPVINVLTLVPNGQLRQATVGLAERPGDAGERRQMLYHLEAALEAGEAEGDSLLEAEGVDAVADPLVLLQVRSAAHGGGARRDAQGRDLDQRGGRLNDGLQRSAGSAQGERLRVCTGKLGGNSNQRLAPGVVARSHYSTHSGGRRT